jgi:hypothetical protein
MGKIRIPPTM